MIAALTAAMVLLGLAVSSPNPTMASLATPAAHGPIAVQCRHLAGNKGGYAEPWFDRVTLANSICTKLHGIIAGNAGTKEIVEGLGPLLHEAGHVAQWRSGIVFTKKNRWVEHDAQCRSLRAMPAALRTLGDSRRKIASATTLWRAIILIQVPPYGGAC
jgi:hypothetical protein